MPCTHKACVLPPGPDGLCGYHRTVQNDPSAYYNVHSVNQPDGLACGEAARYPYRTALSTGPQFKTDPTKDLKPLTPQDRSVHRIWKWMPGSKGLSTRPRAKA